MTKTFEVWCLDQGSSAEDATKVEAYDYRHAAEKWAEWEDAHSAAYWIVAGEPARVCVRLCGASEVKQFIVTGEAEPVYTARAVVTHEKGCQDEQS